MAEGISSNIIFGWNKFPMYVDGVTHIYIFISMDGVLPKSVF